MEAKYKPNHGVCNLIVDVLIDGLVHLLQYPDFCEICCFFGWVFFLNTFPNNVYEQCLFINLSYAEFPPNDHVEKCQRMMYCFSLVVIII